MSSKEAKYVAAALVAKGVCINSVLEELKLFDIPAITLFCDNQSCIKLANNPKMSDNIRHVDFTHHFVCDLIETKKVDLKYTPSIHMQADFLTKPLSHT
jgi:ribosome-binding factor A